MRVIHVSIFAACRVPLSLSKKKKTRTSSCTRAPSPSHLPELALPLQIARSSSARRPLPLPASIFSRASGGAAPPACSRPALPVPLHSHRVDKEGKGVARRAGAWGSHLCRSLHSTPVCEGIVAPRRRRRRLRDERACSR
jgi:hypothetical protein